MGFGDNITWRASSRECSGNQIEEDRYGYSTPRAWVGRLDEILPENTMRLTRFAGVIWNNLTAKGIGGTKNIVKTFPDAFVSFFNIPGIFMRILGYGKKGREFNILKGFRGVAKPGEMILVLGKPGSGCTTFLKVIANQRFGYTGIDGEVLYGPYDHKTFAKRYRGEAVYNQEDDIHHPTLTVGQTLGFALDTKTPGKRPSGLSKKEFKEKVIDLLLKMFNIEHTSKLSTRRTSMPLTELQSTQSLEIHSCVAFQAGRGNEFPLLK
jgi:hypothetical protein